MGLKTAIADAVSDPKILTIDIEVSPAIVMSWGVHEQRISTDAVIEPSRVLCFAAKWMHDDEVIFSDERAGHTLMVEDAWWLLEEADIVIGYNHVAFDVKHLQREFLLAGLQPPSPWLDVDLLKVARRNFKFMSNKLGFVTDSLGMESKLDSGGIRTWQLVMEGDAAAWDSMRVYNCQDTVITEQLFHVLKPWIDGLPHSGLWSGDMSACFACGSSKLLIDGVDRTSVKAYVRLYCDDCGAWNKLLSNGETRSAR